MLFTNFKLLLILRKSHYLWQKTHTRLMSNCLNESQLYYWSKIFNISSIQDVFKDEDNVVTKDINVLARKGLIKQSSSGVFSLMPLLVRSLDKLCLLIDNEMKSIGAQKIIMPSLVHSHLWQKSGRWQESGKEIFKFKNRQDVEYCLAPTHEEVVTQIVASTPLKQSHLPIYLYQITSKFRDEARVKLGLIRAKEFMMKDLYTFDANEEQAKQTYENVCSSYERLFAQLGIEVHKVKGSVGNIGGNFSHEYHIISELGEDELVICNQCGEKYNSELSSDGSQCVRCKSHSISIKKGIEIGHAFMLGTRYSKHFDLSTQDDKSLVQMGCYGLGVSRIIAACLESDQHEPKHLQWPLLLAPFKICVVTPKRGSKEEAGGGGRFAMDFADLVCSKFCEDVLVEDRTHLTIGKRWKDVAALGIPWIVIAGKRVIDDDVPKLEIIDNQSHQSDLYSHSQAIHFIRQRIMK